MRDAEHLRQVQAFLAAPDIEEYANESPEHQTTVRTLRRYVELEAVNNG